MRRVDQPLLRHHLDRISQKEQVSSLDSLTHDVNCAQETDLVMTLHKQKEMNGTS